MAVVGGRLVVIIVTVILAITHRAEARKPREANMALAQRSEFLRRLRPRCLRPFGTGGHAAGGFETELPTADILITFYSIINIVVRELCAVQQAETLRPSGDKSGARVCLIAVGLALSQSPSALIIVMPTTDPTPQHSAAARPTAGCTLGVCTTAHSTSNARMTPSPASPQLH